MVSFALLDETVNPRVELTDGGNQLFDQLDMPLNGDSMVESCIHIEDEKLSNPMSLSNIISGKLQEKLQLARNPFEPTNGQVNHMCGCDLLPSPAETFDVISKGESWLRETLENALLDRDTEPPASRGKTAVEVDASKILLGEINPKQGGSAISVAVQERISTSPKIPKATGPEENDAQSLNDASASPEAVCVDDGSSRGPEESGIKEKAAGPAEKADLPEKKKRKADSELKARRKGSRHWPLPHQPRVATRANPQTRLFSLSDLHDEICPVKRWPCPGRLDRPEYPACMEGVEEEPPLMETESLTEVDEEEEEDSWSMSDRSSESSPAVVDPFLRLESCIVPGALESVVVFCRTSPLLPSPLRPEPDQLRALLHDSCVLQCVLRGVSPFTLAEYLDSTSSWKCVSDYRDLSDAALFVGE